VYFPGWAAGGVANEAASGSAIPAAVNMQEANAFAIYHEAFTQHPASSIPKPNTEYPMATDLARFLAPGQSKSNEKMRLPKNQRQQCEQQTLWPSGGADFCPLMQASRRASVRQIKTSFKAGTAKAETEIGSCATVEEEAAAGKAKIGGAQGQQQAGLGQR